MHNKLQTKTHCVKFQYQCIHTILGKREYMRIIYMLNFVYTHFRGNCARPFTEKRSSQVTVRASPSGPRASIDNIVSTQPKTKLCCNIAKARERNVYNIGTYII